VKVKANVKADHRGRITELMKAAAVQAVTEVSEDILTEANDRSPLDEGDLVRSGEVTVFPDQLAAAITYDTPYAVRQHEDVTLNHPRQGEHHWLEHVVEENADRYFQHIADTIRAATS
jgi:hypothetical protein